MFCGQVAIRFLEDAISRGCAEQPVHNYLVCLYVKLGDGGERLLRFVSSQTVPMFDLKYALRLCHQERLHEVCVHLYQKMHLYQEAVNMALLINLDLAKQVASQLDDQHPDKKGIPRPRLLFESYLHRTIAIF